MITFIRFFRNEWRNYPNYYWFCHYHLNSDQLENLGGDPFRSRFHYAITNAWKYTKYAIKRYFNERGN